VQVGTAFLACEESNAPLIHKEALHSPRARQTALTTGFSGRLARGLRNSLLDVYADPNVARLPYPLQGQLVGALRERAIALGRSEMISLWSGQAAPLIRHRHARELFDDLVVGTERILSRG
jgi:nitronate monooxygenase